MESLDLTSYQKYNDSFRRRMVCRIGVDCGFFIEMNYMVNAILYCLAHRMKFQIYSDNANFGTGVGWTEYFLPFCEEVHEPFHQKYNFHRPPSWHRIFRLCANKKSLGPIAWKLKKNLKTFMGRLKAFRVYGEYVLFAQDVPLRMPQRYCVPELGIDNDYSETYALIARMVWRLRPDILQMEKTYKRQLSLPAVFSGVQIRGGDKESETRLIDGATIIRKLNLSDGDCLFVLTDDYRQFLKGREAFPHLSLLTLCQENETGYYHQQFCQKDFQSKKKAIGRLIISVDILLSCHSFVGSITTGPSIFIMKLRYKDPRVQAIDCPKEELPSALQQPSDVRSAISMRNLFVQPNEQSQACLS